jgi:hypothetical protein
MKTSSEFESYSVIGWAPSVGYLFTLIGGVTLAAAGCHERAASVDANGASPSAYQPAVVTAAAREVLGASAVVQAVEPRQAPPSVAGAAPAISTAAVAPTTPTQPALKPATIQVKRFIVTPGVESREPLPTGETLTLGQPVYAFAELSSGTGGDGEVEIVFEHEGGRKVGHVKLGVPADKARWRTWGQSRGVTKVGHWTAVLFDTEHTELARVAFDVAPEAPAAEPAAALGPEATPETATITPNAIVASGQSHGG